MRSCFSEWFFGGRPSSTFISHLLGSQPHYAQFTNIRSSWIKPQQFIIIKNVLTFPFVTSILHPKESSLQHLPKHSEVLTGHKVASFLGKQTYCSFYDNCFGRDLLSGMIFLKWKRWKLPVMKGEACYTVFNCLDYRNSLYPDREMISQKLPRDRLTLSRLPFSFSITSKSELTLEVSIPNRQ